MKGASYRLDLFSIDVDAVVEGGRLHCHSMCANSEMLNSVAAWRRVAIYVVQGLAIQRMLTTTTTMDGSQAAKLRQR